jgi:hypothetical protein
MAVLVLVLSVSCKKSLTPTGPFAAATFYSFDSSLQGWDSTGIANETLSFNTDANYIKAGGGSVKCSVALSSGGPKVAVFHKSFVTNQDMTSRTVTLWVYVPAALSAAGYFIDLNIKRSSMVNEDTIYGQALNTSGWKSCTFAIPAYSTDTGGAHDYSDVTMMYFIVENIGGTETDWAGDMYFDELSW